MVLLWQRTEEECIEEMDENNARVHLIVPLLHRKHFKWGSNVSKLVQNSDDVHIEYNSISWWLSALQSVRTL